MGRVGLPLARPEAPVPTFPTLPTAFPTPWLTCVGLLRGRSRRCVYLMVLMLGVVGTLGLLFAAMQPLLCIPPPHPNPGHVFPVPVAG